jgi:hypothetical protein
MIRTLRPGYDRNELTPAFGVMFRDHVDQHVVSEGLEVSLRDPQRPAERAQRLQANSHGVFVAHRVRGLRPTAPGAGLVSPMPTRRFDLQVTDALDRYVPLRMSADLPSDGLFQPRCLARSPQLGPAHVPLYSSASRSVGASRVEARVDLRLASNPTRGAAWARLELWLDTTLLVEGVADARGSALLLCPFPALRDPPLRASPPGLDRPRSQWTVTMRAFWEPSVANSWVPDLCVLQRMPEIALLQHLTPATPLAQLLLEADSPLVVRSTGESFVFVGA